MAEGEGLPMEEDDAAPPPEALAAPGRLESVLESLLFASDRAAGVGRAQAPDRRARRRQITAALEALRARRADAGVQVMAVAGGWHLRTQPRERRLGGQLVAGKPLRLSRAMLETLSIVAYRQPITRPEIDDIRGVDCGPVLKTLLDRNLIRIIGKKEEVGRPILYGTTPEFLRIFSLKDLTQLPTLRQFHELGAGGGRGGSRRSTPASRDHRGGRWPRPETGRAPRRARPTPDPDEDDCSAELEARRGGRRRRRQPLNPEQPGPANPGPPTRRIQR